MALTTTRVVLSKVAAQPNDVVEVEWFIGLDARWVPNADDELRLTTGAGVLVSRCPFVRAYTDDCADPYQINLSNAKGKLVCPSVPGGYVIALYDRAANRRVFTMPYRIEGPAFVPPSILSLEFPHTMVQRGHSISSSGGRTAIPITPLGRVTVSFPPSAFAQYAHHTNHVLGIIAPHKGDNDGGQARSSYGSFDRIVRVCQDHVPHATWADVDMDTIATTVTRGGGGGTASSKGRKGSRIITGGGGRGGGGGGFGDSSSDEDSPLASDRGGNQKGYYSNSFHYAPSSAAPTSAAGTRGGGGGAASEAADWGATFGTMIGADALPLQGGGGGGSAGSAAVRTTYPGGAGADDDDRFNNTATGTGRTARAAYASLGNANDGGGAPPPMPSFGGSGGARGSVLPPPIAGFGAMGPSSPSAASASSMSPNHRMLKGRDSVAGLGADAPLTARYNDNESVATTNNIFNFNNNNNINNGLLSNRTVASSAAGRRPSCQGLSLGGPLSPAVEDDVTVSLILPSEPGLYQVRYLTTPASGVPFTVAVSEVFTVERPVGVAGEASTAAEWQQCDIVGEVSCDRTAVCVNERVRVRFNIKSNSGRRLTPLDVIVFYPFGRSEQIEHHDAMYHAIGEHLYEGVLEVPAPPNEGFYQVGYYSFLAQHVVAVGEAAVSVRLPVAKLLLSAGLSETTKATNKAVYQVDSGDTVSFAFEIEDHIFSKQDQIIVLDDLANKVATAAIQTIEYGEQRRHTSNRAKAELVRLVSGTAEVTVPMPGKYSVHYYSKVRQCPITQLQAYVQLRPALGGVPLPFATIRAVSVLPMNEPIAVAVMREGHDARSAEEMSQDCIIVYDEQQRDCVVAPSPDHPDSYPGMYVHFLRGNMYGQFSIPSLMSLLEARQSGFVPNSVPISLEGRRRVVLRYMASLPGHFARVCTSEAVVTLRDPAQMVGFVRQQLKYVAVHDLALGSHRFSPDGRIAAPIAKPTKNLLTRGPRGEQQLVVARGLNHATLNNHNANNNTAAQHASSTGNGAGGFGGTVRSAGSGRDFSRGPRGSVLGLDGTLGGGGGGGSLLQTATIAGMFLNFLTSGTEFKGAVMGPREATTSEAIRVVYHITGGVPRAADRLVLFSRDGCRTISDGLVEYAVACHNGPMDGIGELRNTTEDGTMRLGELLLNPPSAEGTYVAGYFSERHQSVVLVSAPFMVSASPDTFIGGEGMVTGQDVLSAHRRRAAKAKEEAALLLHANAVAMRDGGGEWDGNGGGSGGGADASSPSARAPPMSSALLQSARTSLKSGGILTTLPSIKRGASAASPPAPLTTLTRMSTTLQQSSSPQQKSSLLQQSAQHQFSFIQGAGGTAEGSVINSSRRIAGGGGGDTNGGPVGTARDGFGSPTLGKQFMTMTMSSMIASPLSMTNNGCGGGGGDAAEVRTRRRRSLFSTASGGGTRSPRTKILIVAVGTIQLDKELKGPLNDIELFKEASTEFFFGGLRVDAEEHTLVLSEGRDNGPESIPTAHNIRKGIRWLTDGAQEGDHLVFYYTGCGTVIDGDNAIVPCNYDAVSRHITYLELHTTLLAAAPKGCSVSAFIDACYWGSLRDSAMQLQLAPPESVAANAIRRRRNRSGIAPEAPWRALALPIGAAGVAHPLVTEVSLGTLDALGYFLPERFNPVVAIQGLSDDEPASRLQSYHSFNSDMFTRSAASVLKGGLAPAGEAKHRLIMEASSGSYYSPEGAWDAFNRFTGRTVGVFTCSLCQVLKELAPKASDVRWWEVHERVVREVAKSPYPQVPRVIVQASEALDRLVHTT